MDSGDDPIELLFARGVTDGLPAVPPTAARGAAAVAASDRSRDELVTEMPPRLGRATVEKIAVNAVKAGCRPEYLPRCWPRSRRSATSASACSASPGPPTR